MDSVSQGTLIFSRSWSLDLGSQENQNVICDALLIAQDHPLVLYTLFRVLNKELIGYSLQAAFTLKHKLVKICGYTGKMCVVRKIFYVNGEPSTLIEDSASSFHDISFQIFYPKSYNLEETQTARNLNKVLHTVLMTHF